MMKPKKILGICGTPKKGGSSSSRFLLEKALEAAAEEGAETKLVNLADYNILECKGCGQCMAGKHCHLLKKPEDELAKIYKECKEADGFVFSSPVYALSLPAMWKNWIDRCEPCEDEDLEFEEYCYDTVQYVKGKALRGKVAGQIAVATGTGHEWALTSLLPAFTAVRLTIVASAGLSLAEYDGQPRISKQPWAKKIEDAQFAIDMARSVGKRVFQTIGFSAYKIDSTNRTMYLSKTVSDDENSKERHNNGSGITVQASDLSFEDLERQEVKSEAFKDKNILFVASGQKSSKQAAGWMEFLLENCSKNDRAIFDCVLVGKLPPFISKDFVTKKLKTKLKEMPVLIDWEKTFADTYGIREAKVPTLVYINKQRKMVFAEQYEFNEENQNNIQKQLKILDDQDVS